MWSPMGLGFLWGRPVLPGVALRLRAQDGVAAILSSALACSLGGQPDPGRCPKPASPAPAEKGTAAPAARPLL